MCAHLFGKVHRLNIAFVNELDHQFQYRGKVIPGLFIAFVITLLQGILDEHAFQQH